MKARSAVVAVSFRTHARRMLLAAVVGLLAAPTATRAEAPSAPDSAQIAVLRFGLQSFEDVRVVTGSTKLVGHHAVVLPDGLQFGFTSGTSITSPLQVRLVPWADIESIQVRRGASGAGPFVGGAAGLVTGLLVAAVEATSAFLANPTPQKKLNTTPILGGLVGGATLGWLVDHPGRWKTVYP